MVTNIEKFQEQLAKEYTRLYSEQPEEYAYAASRNTPEALAKKMTDALAAGTANKDSKGIARALKHFGIKNTYKAIKEYLK